jgi:hypothetical protein
VKITIITANTGLGFVVHIDPITTRKNTRRILLAHTPDLTFRPLQQVVDVVQSNLGLRLFLSMLDPYSEPNTDCVIEAVNLCSEIESRNL